MFMKKMPTHAISGISLSPASRYAFPAKSFQESVQVAAAQETAGPHPWAKRTGIVTIVKFIRTARPAAIRQDLWRSKQVI